MEIFFSNLSTKLLKILSSNDDVVLMKQKILCWFNELCPCQENLLHCNLSSNKKSLLKNIVYLKVTAGVDRLLQFIPY